MGGADTSPTSLLVHFVDLHCCPNNTALEHKGIRALNESNGYETDLVSFWVRTNGSVLLVQPRLKFQ
jgi:hypothetical protein